MGNLRSVENVNQYLGFDKVRDNDRKEGETSGASHIILPGVSDCGCAVAP